MANTTAQDPWVNVRTKHGLPADEVISALQKEIRRGNTENAVLIAYEMISTSAELEAYLWKRLMVISVEDVGFGSPQAPVLVHTLYQMHLLYGRHEGDRLLYALHAVRFLSTSQKDRSTDEMAGWIKYIVDVEGHLPEIPEYAIDMHTARGQKMGRDFRHFLLEGTQLSPELPGRDTSYRQKLLEMVEGDT